LGDRIKTLESQVSRLQSARSSPDGDSSFAAAERTLRRVRRSNSVPRGYDCVQDRGGWAVLPAPLGAEGCFVDGGKANLRSVVPAAGCHQLDVATESPDRRIAPLHQQAVRYTYSILTWVSRDIPLGNVLLPPDCR